MVRYPPLRCSALRLPRLAAPNFCKSTIGCARVVLYQSHSRCTMMSATIMTSRARSTVNRNPGRAFRLRLTRRGTGLPLYNARMFAIAAIRPMTTTMARA
jgi:hypothetical protein